MPQYTSVKVRAYRVHEWTSFLCWLLGGMGIIVPWNTCHFTVAIEVNGEEMEWELTWVGLKVRHDRTHLSREWVFVPKNVSLYLERLHDWVSCDLDSTCRKVISPVSLLTALVRTEYTDSIPLTCIAFVESVLTGQHSKMAVRPKMFVNWLSIHGRIQQ